MKRITKLEYYMETAKTVALRSTCLRRRYGAVVVHNDSIVSAGYNGSPRGMANCIDLDKCYRQEMNIPHGSNYELCRSVHAEQNAIINAARAGAGSIIDGEMYIFGADVDDPSADFEVRPCKICAKFILNSGIKRVFCCCGAVTDRRIVSYVPEQLVGMCD